MRIKFIRALTLIELMIATMLIGTLIAGVLAFALNLRRIHVASNIEAALAVNVSTIMARLHKIAYEASGTIAHPGIIDSGDGTWIAFYDQARNRWDVFKFAAAQHAVCHRRLAGAGFDDALIGAGVCLSAQGDEILSHQIVEARFNFYNSDAPDPDSESFNSGAVKVKFYLRAWHNPAPYVDQNSLPDLMTNADYKLETSVYPPSHSWN